MPEVLQNVMSNAQSLEGAEYVGFGLICALAAVGVFVFLYGVYLFFKLTHSTSVVDLSGAVQGVFALMALLGGTGLLAIAVALMTIFFGGS